MMHRLRIAWPASDLRRSADLYRRALGQRVVGSVEDHQGFVGDMLGFEGAGYHFEFTYCRAHPVAPAPTAKDPVVLYIPDAGQWQRSCPGMSAAGFQKVTSFNPHWESRGRAFQDHDGYRTVLRQEGWHDAGAP